MKRKIKKRAKLTRVHVAPNLRILAPVEPMSNQALQTSAEPYIEVSTPDFRTSVTWVPETPRRKGDRRRPDIFKASIGIISDRRQGDRRAR